MAKITAVIVAVSNTEKLKYTLESVVSQSIEDFNVLVVTKEDLPDITSMTNEYVNEYVGFEKLVLSFDSISDAKNTAIKNIKTELFFFIEEGDYIAPEFVECILEAHEKAQADIYASRLYVSGENEPYYHDWADMLATVPHVDKFDRALLNSLDLPGRVYKKKYFDLYAVSFPAQPILCNATVLTKCVLGCGAVVSGVAGAIYDMRSGVYADGFDENNEPGKTTFEIACRYFDALLQEIKDVIQEETGAFDGDEYTYQEANYIYFCYITNHFYRYFWYLDDELIGCIRTKFDLLTERMTKDRRNKIATDFADLHFPGVYTSRADAAKLPMVSLFGDFTEYSELKEFTVSLYNQKLPFFELFLRESAKDSVPKRWLTCENLHFLPDEGFFTKARKQAIGVPINVKDTTPVDPKLLSELSLKKLPKSMYQYAFAAQRKKYSAKTYLKKKGMAIR